MSMVIENLLLSPPSAFQTKLIAIIGAANGYNAMQLLTANIAGCLFRNEINESIVHLIRIVAGGHTSFSRATVQWLLSATLDQTLDQNYDHLTASERRVLTGIVRGWDNRYIAQELGLSEQTVRNYVANIYAKLETRSRAELVARFRTHVTEVKE